MSDALPEPDEPRSERAVRDKKRIEQRRRRLSNISWFMAILCEHIGRRANKDDGVTGRFFESRFKSRRCADMGGMLICALYVDLNPILAMGNSSREFWSNVFEYALRFAGVG